MLTLTSIRRTDVGPSEAIEMARRIERGDVSFHDFHASSNQPDLLRRTRADPRERDLIIQALQAYA